MANQLFGTDGIRGVPGEYPLDDATLARVGAALGEYLRSLLARPRVLVGRDTRESGPHIAGIIANGLASAGAEPVSAGVLTTPGGPGLVEHEELAAGVVISASHNPYHDNGVKLISASGMKFPDAVEGELEEFVFSSTGPAAARGAVMVDAEKKMHDDYLAGLVAAVPAEAKLAGLKVVLDCGNGAASELAPQLFRSLGAEVTAINHAPNGRNINAGCGSLHP
jgi:phosphoglucosamine mutase